METASAAALGGPILRDVSRSFFLSLRLLPRELREPISLAYLLARATDTIADTAEVEASARAEMLAQLANAIQHGGTAPAIVERFAPLQNDPAERRLIEQLSAILEWLERVEAEDAASVRAVLLSINEGQRLDVVRFGDRSRVVALQTAEELMQYTYLVAGCV